MPLGACDRQMSQPPQQSLSDCGKQNHLWIIVLKPGEHVTCRRCGKKRRGRKL